MQILQIENQYENKTLIKLRKTQLSLAPLLLLFRFSILVNQSPCSLSQAVAIMQISEDLLQVCTNPF